MTQTITIGSRVSVLALSGNPPGTVMSDRSDDNFTVMLDTHHDVAHDCAGLLLHGHGWYASTVNLKLLAPKTPANPSCEAPVYPRLPLTYLADHATIMTNPEHMASVVARLPTATPLELLGDQTEHHASLYRGGGNMLGYSSNLASYYTCAPSDHWILSRSHEADDAVRSRMSSIQGRQEGRLAPNPFHGQSWWDNNISRLVELLPVPSRQFLGKISVFVTPADRLRDRETAMKAGRFLRRYFGDLLSEQEIQDFGLHFEQTCAPAAAIVTQDADEIERVYLNGPSSCMSHDTDDLNCDIHPSRVYAGPDLAVAYLGTLDKPTARAVVWPDKKLFTTVYGDVHRLTAALEAAGYNARGSFSGARLQRMPEGARFVMPYLDMASHVNDEGDFLVIATNCGEIECQNTGGYSDDADDGRMMCAINGTMHDEEDMTYVSEYGLVCEDALQQEFIHCPVSEEYVHHHNTTDVTLGNGETISVSDDAIGSNPEMFTECDGDGVLYLSDIPRNGYDWTAMDFVYVDGCAYSQLWADEHAGFCSLTDEWFLNEDLITLADGDTVSREAFNNLDEDDQAANPERVATDPNQLNLALAA